jgi:hypothetical protein
MNPAALLKLKHPQGWFPAGPQMETILTQLADGPFKLFVYLCLHARRDTGTLETSQNSLAKNLRKSRRSVGSYLKQLQEAGVCHVQMTQNPHLQGLIEICEDYWPYHRGPSEPVPEDESAYVTQVRQLLLARPCVSSSFSLADQRLARQWFEQGVPLERVEQTLLLGCTRKYAAWRNGQTQTPIASLRYFESILEEVSSQTGALSYWSYLRYRMERLEKLWVENHPRSQTPQSLASGQPPDAKAGPLPTPASRENQPLPEVS